MLPLLQYSATSALYGGTLLPYFLNEGQAWELDIDNLRGQIKHVRACLGKTTNPYEASHPHWTFGLLPTKYFTVQSSMPVDKDKQLDIDPGAMHQEI